MASRSCLPVVLKRPAARQTVRPRPKARQSVEPALVQYAPDGDAEADSAAPPADWARPVPVSQPSWAQHIVRVLQGGGHLPGRTGQEKELTVTVWSDCSGINSEMIALREFRKQLLMELGVSVNWDLHCTCDSDQMSRRFSELNHGPARVSDNMVHRNFEAGCRGQAWACMWGRIRHVAAGERAFVIQTHVCPSSE